ncbi:hypothetical protein OBBRIDRAFT_39696 [Obba rivulosa]|uniref:Uncharacterized protein n=1 Tax=Obba rivulosa TaxID=1052685 RepID=A0A8E2AYQ9_9APHY|nr:hypothetical protein OBBRIDRAFT_39696 [Obba rivulosa]
MNLRTLSHRRLADPFTPGLRPAAETTRRERRRAAAKSRILHTAHSLPLLDLSTLSRARTVNAIAFYSLSQSLGPGSVYTLRSIRRPATLPAATIPHAQLMPRRPRPRLSHHRHISSCAGLDPPSFAIHHFATLRSIPISISISSNIIRTRSTRCSRPPRDAPRRAYRVSAISDPDRRGAGYSSGTATRILMRALQGLAS